MRLLFITNFYPPHISYGYDHLCDETADYLKAKHHEVKILTGNFGVSTKTDTADAELEKLRILKYANYAQASSYDRYMVDRYNFKATVKVISEYQPDLVIFWDLSGISIAPILAVQKLKQSHLFSISDFWPDRYVLQGNTARLKRFLKRALPNTIGGKLNLAPNIVPTTSLQEHLAQHFHTGDSYLIPFMCQIPDSPPEKNYDLNSNKIQLMILGNQSENSGLNVLFEALGNLQKRDKFYDYNVNIYGQIGTTYLLKLKQELSRFDLEEKVKIKSMPENQLDAYNENHLFLIPELSSPRDIKQAINAMAAGLPVICSNQYCSAEYISHKQTGFIFPAEDSDLLAGHILQLARNPVELKQLANMAREVAVKKYNQDILLPKLEELIIKEVMKKHD